jgi:Autographiviridae endonuclease VII
MINKICSKCGVEKAESEFYKTSGKTCKVCHNNYCKAKHRLNPEKGRESSKRWYYSKPENRQRSIDKAREWQAKHKDRDTERKFKYNLQRNYGLAYEDYCRMAEEQNGLCAICEQPPYRNFDVDHNHQTGVVRQLLCSNCNTALGLLKDNPDILRKAAVYLEQHSLQATQAQTP